MDKAISSLHLAASFSIFPIGTISIWRESYVSTTTTLKNATVLVWLE
jgi:hypothetical protein